MKGAKQMWLNYLPRKLLDWLTGKAGKEQSKKVKEIISNSSPPPPQIQIRTIQDVQAVTQIKTFRDVKAFCEEVRKTLRIYKKFYKQIEPEDFLLLKQTINRLYVEVGNLSDKVDRLTVRQKGEI